MCIPKSFTLKSCRATQRRHVQAHNATIKQQLLEHPPAAPSLMEPGRPHLLRPARLSAALQLNPQQAPPALARHAVSAGFDLSTIERIPQVGRDLSEHRLQQWLTHPPAAPSLMEPGRPHLLRPGCLSACLQLTPQQVPPASAIHAVSAKAERDIRTCLRERERSTDARNPINAT